MKHPRLLPRLIVSMVALGTPLAAAQDTTDPDPVAPDPVVADAAENDAPQTVTLDMPPMVSAQQWGSDPDPIPEDRRHTPAFITIHHAGVLWKAGSDPAAKARGLQAFGKREKGWPDLPYHYLIAPDGTIYEGRPVEYEPETNTSYDVTGHIGIQLWGNFDEQRVSPRQMDSLVALAAWLVQEHGIDTDNIAGHNDRAPTACPGKDLDRYLENAALIRWVEQAAAGQTPNINLGDPLPDGPMSMIPDATPAPDNNNGDDDTP